MKKYLFILLLLFSIPSFANDGVELWFKNGNLTVHTAHSVWTTFHYKHNYKQYIQNNVPLPYFNVESEDYLCFYDWCTMNPVSRETKRQDFKNLRDKIQETGNEANYFELNGVLSDDWCVSVRYDQLDKVEVNNKVIYSDGEKK